MATGTIKQMETLTPVVTKTSGANVESASAVQVGHFVQVTIEFKNGSSATAAGMNGFTGTISGIPLPAGNAIGASYSGGAGLMMLIDPTGSIVLRVIAANWNQTALCTATVLYIAT